MKPGLVHMVRPTLIVICVSVPTPEPPATVNTALTRLDPMFTSGLGPYPAGIRSWWRPSPQTSRETSTTQVLHTKLRPRKQREEDGVL